MKKNSGHILAIITALAGCVLMMLSGCSTPQQEGFAIYLTKADIPPAEMPALSQIDLAQGPIVPADDIITYNAQTHEIKLTDSAFERIFLLEVPLRGKSFVVCVDKKPVYWGAFWIPISSISFDGVTIWKPLSGQGEKVIKLDLGYPSASFYGGEDPRNDPKIMRSLEQSGKIITRLPITSVNELPRSAKGYELYSWSADNQWRFTLITGTNRAKMLDEIVSEEDFISEDGWVAIHGLNQETIKTAFSNLPLNEPICWLRIRLAQASQDRVDITLPPKEMIDTLKEYAGEYDIDLVVAVR